MYEINLLPPELQKKVAIDVSKMLVPLVVVVILIVMGGSYWLLQMKQYQAAAETARIDVRLNEISPLVRKIERMKRERLDGEKKIKTYRQITAQRATFIPMLNAIAQTMPVDMWLTDISLENRREYAARGGFASPPGVLAMNEQPEDINNKPGNNTFSSDSKDNDPDGEEGVKEVPPPNLVVLKGVSYSPASVGVFINNLSGLPYFRNIDLIETSVKKLEGSTGQAFCIEARLREGKQDVSKS